MPSAVCLGCGARVDDDAPCGCATLGTNPYRGAAPPNPMGRCPRCADVLLDVDYADTPLDECTRCGGVFVEGWILDRLTEARDARISLSISLPVRKMARETAVRYLRCPRCTAQMNRKIFGLSSGVVVDVCKEDGIWFDAGELGVVLEFIESGGLERARAREVKQREEDLRREKTRRETDGPASVGLMISGRPRTATEVATEVMDALLEWWRP